jgi:hypothetical protein
MLVRINDALDSKNQLIFLNLLQVENDDAPPVVWNVFVAPPNSEISGAQSPFFVGTLATFEKAAKFRYPLNRPLAESIRVNSQHKAKHQLVVLTLVPHGPLINGKPTTPTVKSPTKVKEATLTVEINK